MLFGHDVKIQQAITLAAGAAGTSVVNSTAISLAGYDGCCFVVQFGPITAGAATSIKVQQDTDSAFGDPADLEGSNQTIADSDDDQIRYIDVSGPREDFVRVVVSRATQSATCSAMAYLYGSRSRPVTHGTNVAGEVFVRPAEGTA